jgi:hypothetical protein
MRPICELPNHPLFNLCWIFWCWLMIDNNGCWKWCTNSCCNTWFTNRCYNMWFLILNITMGENCNPNLFYSNEYSMDYCIPKTPNGPFQFHVMNVNVQIFFINWSSFPYIFGVKLFTYKFVWWTHHIINRHETLQVWCEQNSGHKLKNDYIEDEGKMKCMQNLPLVQVVWNLKITLKLIINLLYIEVFTCMTK